MPENFDLIVRGGAVWSSAGPLRLDIGVRAGKIAALAPELGGQAAEVVDASGLDVLPGLIDSQVHFREPGLEHKEDLESGTRSAVLGGVTTILEMPNTQPPTTSPEALADKLRRASGRAWCDHGFFLGATAENAEHLGEWERLPGTPGIKIFMGSSTGSLLVDDDADLKRVLAHGSRPCPVHAEDEARLSSRKALLEEQPHVRRHSFVRDPEAAAVAIRRLVAACRATGRPIHVLHVSTRAELEVLRAAKAEGLPVTCEATPQHLTLNDEAYETLGSLAQMNPPLRAEEERQALWAAVLDGTIDVLGSDHAPHTLEEKATPYPKSPSGMPGVQTMLSVMLNHVAEGRLTLERLVQMACEAPASLYCLAGKGTVAVRADADFSIVDRTKAWTVARGDLATKCGWSPFEGRTLRGRAVMTVLRGTIVMRDGATVGSPSGRPAAYDWK